MPERGVRPTDLELQVSNVLVAIDALRVELLLCLGGFFLCLLASLFNRGQPALRLFQERRQMLRQDVWRQSEVRLRIQIDLGRQAVLESALLCLAEEKRTLTSGTRTARERGEAPAALTASSAMWMLLPIATLNCSFSVKRACRMPSRSSSAVSKSARSPSLLGVGGRPMFCRAAEAEEEDEPEILDMVSVHSRSLRFDSWAAVLLTYCSARRFLVKSSRVWLCAFFSAFNSFTA